MFNNLKKYYQEPLLHFLVLGLVLYSLVDVFSASPSRDNYGIDVNTSIMVRFLQFQNKTFNAKLAKEKWQSLDESEKQNYITDYIREEVMYREALNMNLDLDDQIIRNRLIQKIEFINSGFTSSIAGIDKKILSDYFNENIPHYIIEGSITFSHVFFDKDLVQDKDQHEKKVQKTLLELNGKSVPFEQASQFGQRFFFHRNYVDRTQNFVTSHFGLPFSQKVFTLQPSNAWYGPIKSKYGSHLVMVKNNHPERIPELVEVAPQVLQDLKRVQKNGLKTASLNIMINKYTINNKLKINNTDTGGNDASID
jgi:peptidyl-prolyl cis-trans isomerase C